MPLPILIQSGLGQFRLGIEEVIEAALFHPRLVADLVDGRAAVGTRPDQLFDGFHQSFFGITDAAHILRFVPFCGSNVLSNHIPTIFNWTKQSTTFLKIFFAPLNRGLFWTFLLFWSGVLKAYELFSILIIRKSDLYPDIAIISQS